MVTQQTNMVLDIEEFNPTVAELNKLAEEARTVTVTDFTDEEQLKLVKKVRIGLRNARVLVEKRGKEMRADAVIFQKAVIGKEKELIEIISPEEDRLQGLEDEAQRLADLEQRKLALPIRREKLDAIKDGIADTDEELLAMDAPAFQEYLNRRIGNKNEVDRLANEKRQNELKEEEQRREKEAEEIKRQRISARSDRLFALGLKYDGRVYSFEGQSIDFIIYDEVGTISDEQWNALMASALPKIDQMKADAQAIAKQKLEEAEARGRREAEERAQKEKDAQEEAQRKEKERLEKEESYKMWLAGSGFDKDTCILKDTGTEIIMYRRVGSFLK